MSDLQNLIESSGKQVNLLDLDGGCLICETCSKETDHLYEIELQFYCVECAEFYLRRSMLLESEKEWIE